MAPATVRFHPAAAQEAESAYDWYAARYPTAAHSFREELAHAVAALTNNSLTWPRYGPRARRYVLQRSPFSLVYRIRRDEIEIMPRPRQATAGQLALAALNGRRASAFSGPRFAPPLIRRVSQSSEWSNR
jgi:plasmid stabilization system protein ParE